MGAVRRLTACASQEPPTLREQDVSEDSERLPDGKDPDQPGIFLRAAMTADQPRVVVVGAGPVGLLAAGDLAAAGIDVTVIEKRAEGVSGPARPGPSQVPERQSDRETSGQPSSPASSPSSGLLLCRLRPLSRHSLASCQPRELELVSDRSTGPVPCRIRRTG
jgi:hypothetical protein